jgi:quercetin dioxygenase-like cupin family protein
MKYFKNINPYEAIPLNSVVNHRGNQIASKAIINSENIEMRFFSLAKGESIDKEYYEMETVFIMIEGSLKIVYKENDEVIINAGDMLALEADIDYGLEVLEDSKMYNILVKY